MPLVLAGATSGSTTLTPTDAVTTTLTLPSTTGTLLSTANPQSGGVIQVVQGTTTTNTSTSSTSFVSTNLTASITPKFSTSKIVAIISGAMYENASNNQGFVTLYRNAVELSGQTFGFPSSVYSSAGGIVGAIAFSYMDSPATTSSTSYTLYIKTSAGTLNFNNANSLATIILLEVAA
jgi:hypothetical protein